MNRYIVLISKFENQIACGHPALKKLFDNSISGQKQIKKKAYKAFKSKKDSLKYY